MFLKKLDLISPPISLYFKGMISHKSILSGILTILINVITLSFGIYFSKYYFQKKNPKVFSFTRYTENAGNFPINSESMFNFIQLTDIKTNSPESIDFEAINIIGTELEISLVEKSDLSQNDHWIYGKCNNNTDTKGIANLINFDKFNESACIRKYYNKNDKKYYDTSDEKFRWPILKYGCSHPNRTFYGIIIEKCKNDTLRLLNNNKFCKSKNEIANYVQSRAVNFQIIDHFADILSYKNPLIKYFYSISNGMFENSYTTNHLNFNPLNIVTNEGIFFDAQKSILSYYFEQNEKIVTTKNNTNIYVAFYFWLQNKTQYHKREYEKLQDTLSSIGGLGSILLMGSKLINLIICQFISIIDIEEFLNEISTPKRIYKNMFFNFNKMNNDINDDIIKNENNKYENNINNINNVNNNSVTNIEPIKNNETTKNDTTQKSSDSNSSFTHLKLFKENIKINNVNKRKLTNDKINFIIKRSNTVNERDIRKNFIQISKTDKNKLINTNLTQKIPMFLKNNNINKQKVDKNEENIENKNEVRDNIINEKMATKDKNIVKFLEFLFYIICYRKSKRKTDIKFYDNFRRKIISEENIILNYFNICKIIQI